MSATPYNKQISNRNYLSPVGFKFILSRYPRVDFFCTKAGIPGVSLGVAIQPTYLKDIPIPGDKLEYEDLVLDFLVDEDLVNYIEVYNWLIGLGYPENVSQFNEWRATNTTDPSTDGKDLRNIYSDATLQVLNSNFQPQANIKFRDIFPTSLTGLSFDTTKKDYDYFTARVTFKYTIYNIMDQNYNEYEPR